MDLQPILQALVLGISVLTAILVALGLAVWFSLIIWTYHDIRLRSRDLFTQLMATLMVAVLFIPGALVYILLRPPETLDAQRERRLLENALTPAVEPDTICPACRHAVEPRWMVCPFCLYQLREPCPQCGELMELEWRSCAYCGHLMGEHRQALPSTAAVAPSLPATPELAALPERTERPSHAQLMSGEARPAA